MAVNQSENKDQDGNDAQKAISAGTAPTGFAIIGTPPNRSELVAQQNVFALNLRNK